MEGRFCAKCGAPAAAESGPGGGQRASAGLADNVAGALAYIPLLGPIFFLWLSPAHKGNRKVRFHAWQSLYLFLALIALGWLMDLLLPWWLRRRMDPLVSLGGTILWIFLVFKTYKDEKVVLPGIGPLAEKQV